MSKLVHYVSFDHCAYGGQRQKQTAIAHNCAAFASLARFCPGPECAEQHLPWGRDPTAPNGFATSQETANPSQLAAGIALAFIKGMVSRGWDGARVALDIDRDKLATAAERAIAGVQSKASRFPAPVSEHKMVVVLRSRRPLTCPCEPGKRLEQPFPLPAGVRATPFVACVPAKSQLLRSTPISVKVGDWLAGSKVEAEQLSFEQAWGVPHSEAEFVEAAVKAGHPSSFREALPDVLQKAVKLNETMDDADLAKMRTHWIRKWAKRAEQLAPEEEELKKTLHPSCRAILEPKRLLLYKEILTECNYPDPGAFDELLQGTQLTGEVPITGIFTPTFKPAKTTVDQVKREASSIRSGVLSKVRPTGELDAEVMKKTWEECKAGWLEGPIPLSELESSALVSRRFGVVQGSKVRVIDDFSLGGVNGTVQVAETPRPHATDKVAALCLALLAKCGRSTVLGRTFDLKSAYRQLAVSPESSWASYVACWDPAIQAPRIFRMRALPFGASRAVYAFLRVAMSLWFVAADQLAIPWTSFFDDFVTFGRGAGSTHLQHTVEAFFKLLGWGFAESGDKAQPFALSFHALGIKVDLSKFCEGSVLFSNTEKRISELRDTFQKILETGLLPQSFALKLRGRMQFADGQLFGRTGKACMRTITSFAYGDAGPVLTPAARNAIARFLKRLCADAPRVISILSERPWFVFTDASYDVSNRQWPCGLGGILFNQSGQAVEFFSVCLTAEQIRLLGGDRSQQIIFEAELLALVVAARKWGPSLFAKPVMFYVDNNSTRDVAISASARTCIPSSLLEQLVHAEERLSFYPWYSRVPSPSNPADSPSRELLQILSWKGRTLKASDVSETLCDCFSLLEG